MRLAFLGDVMLGRLVNRALQNRPPTDPWGDVLPVLRGTDGVVCNLECVLSDRGTPWPGKLFTFRSDARNVRVLEAGGVRAVSLANNHVLDFGEDALADCLQVLDAAGIAHAGAGRDAEEAQRPARWTCGRTRVGLVAFTDNEPGWEAAPGRPGVFYAPVDPEDPRFQRVVQLTRQLAAEVDAVVVSAHWGPNWGRRPLPEHREAARLLARAGAQVVWGHSAHIVRGVEFVDACAVLYSCGDFVDDYAVDEVERNDWSFAFLLEWKPGGVEVELVPTTIRHFRAGLAHGWEREAICQRMRELCAELGTEVQPSEQGLRLRPSPELRGS
ncbi:MAG: CapA family protein [Armatimonadota bacterium]|nr:CapA family protein [Armatimonadota bacterium]MDR7388585.1 CapA family protein [Armatimonadota bacterium]MDR7394136.1 CapA family protein [Armatimonadota bacterium]MDR7397166.1 CapA family protein [Armatimonadota bacterium]MDR7398098.1 CapA family protein [Armatimonadota bacterium]